MLHFISGFLFSMAYMVFAYFFFRYVNKVTEAPTSPSTSVFPSFRKKEKKKPKSFSDEDLWRKEQEVVPKDPLYKP